MSIFQTITMPQDKIVTNSDGSLKPVWLTYFGQIERISQALDAYVPPTPPAQKLAQVVSNEVRAFTTGSVAIPADNTVPQATEGTQYLSVAITPTSATSTLYISVTLSVATLTTAQTLTAALFQDSTVGALAASGVTSEAAGVLRNISFNHIMTAGTTSATTFKVRMGAGTAVAAWVNGTVAGGQIYGNATSVSSITISEVLA